MVKKRATAFKTGTKQKKLSLCGLDKNYKKKKSLKQKLESEFATIKNNNVKIKYSKD